MGLLPDLADPAFLEDPYPVFRRILAAGPVLHDDEHKMWLVTGHAEILEALKHPAASVATAGARIAPALGSEAARFAPLIGAVSRFLTRLDPPDHTRLRALLTKVFTLETVERMQNAIGALVEGYLAPPVSAGEPYFKAKSDYARAPLGPEAIETIRRFMAASPTPHATIQFQAYGGAVNRIPANRHGLPASG
jgi:cytochrome P450